GLLPAPAGRGPARVPRPNPSATRVRSRVHRLVLRAQPPLRRVHRRSPRRQDRDAALLVAGDRRLRDVPPPDRDAAPPRARLRGRLHAAPDGPVRRALVAALLLLTLPASAKKGNGAPPNFGENPSRRYESSQWFALEIKLSPYSPHIDSSAG